MKKGRYPILLFIFIIALLVLALITESVYFSNFEYHLRTKRFNKILSAKESVMEKCLNSMKPILARDNHHGSITENNLFSEAVKNKISILEYLDGKLAEWSDNEFNVPLVLADSLFEKPLVFLQNGWFLTSTVKAGNEKIVGLLRIHSDYSFENNIIKSGFESSFHMPANVDLSLDKNASGFHVFNNKGDFLFSIIFPPEKGNTSFILIPLLLWASFFILIIIFLLEFVNVFIARGKELYGILMVFIVFSLLYLILILTSRPLSVFQTELFSPFRFSMNKIIPSLGHLLILGIMTAAFSIVVFRHFQIKERQRKNRFIDYLLLSFILVTGASILCIYQFIFNKLILTSNISFETYKVLDLNAFSVAGFISLFLLLLCPLLFLLKMFQFVRQFKKGALSLSLLTSFIILFISFHKDPETLVTLVLYYSLLIICIWMFIRKRIGLFNVNVIFSVITGLYFLYFITILSEKRTIENLKIQAVSFSTENDPEAEHLLLDMWPEMEKDSVLQGMMGAEYFLNDNYVKISSYLQETYFNGFWKNYHFSSFPCQSDQSLKIVSGAEVSQNCFSFFDDRIKRDGHRLTGTDFYSIDNQGGRAYYLGRVLYKSKKNQTNGLFIELYREVNVFQPGYSELLLDKKYQTYSGPKNYSFAKYINGEIVLRTPDFPYDKTDAEYIDKFSDYRIFKTEGYKHVLYKNGNATVIIARPVLTPRDIIISFAYIFAFILFFSNLIILIVRRPIVKSVNVFNFRQKLQLSYIGILLFSFILIGIVVAYITIGQYKEKHYENIKEKLNSVYLELDNKLSMEKRLSSEWRGNGYASLNDLLIKLSNVFNTDINLFDLSGFLIATSRQEIFYRDLISMRINNNARINLEQLNKSEYYQNEKIGNLEYLSAYVPFFNSENDVIAYLNLPYFRMQSVLAKEISNLIVAIINFTLLLVVITMGLAVFISGRLTAPLSMLSEGLSTVGVGKKSEHLTYAGNDEIGELVKQYNRMVDEIEESSKKLADSEREYAWREMAKQIAHEIKNPLTPMKLNVQQLFKSWNDKVPGFEIMLGRFTKNQIEYIDNLSSIASAFSSFAKMPVATPVEVNILDQIRLTLELFKNTGNVTFSVQWPRESRIIIFADREQLNGVFSNLIKNAIQAIPYGQKGLIILGVEVKGDRVIVKVADNGSGIPDDLRNSLFTPNFTTKSSGMGLGLSIAKKYIESANGNIWFESYSDKGTVFYFDLPVLYTVEKPGA